MTAESLKLRCPDEYYWSCTESLAYLRTLTDRELSKRLDLVRQQQKMAFDQRNNGALRNLQMHEDAIISIRLEST